jgi:hypothetical protein
MVIQVYKNKDKWKIEKLWKRKNDINVYVLIFPSLAMLTDIRYIKELQFLFGLWHVDILWIPKRAQKWGGYLSIYLWNRLYI